MSRRPERSATTVVLLLAVVVALAGVVLVAVLFRCGGPR